MQYDYHKLRGRIVEKFETLSKFADALGVHLTVISNKLNGNRDITKSDILAWSKLLDIKPSEYGEFFLSQKS